jgi:hypothetical protein
MQQGIVTDSGTGRPEMIIHLPGGKRIAVDTKVPFTASLEAVARPPSSTPSGGFYTRACAEHVQLALRLTIIKFTPNPLCLVFWLLPSFSFFSPTTPQRPTKPSSPTATTLAKHAAPDNGPSHTESTLPLA